MTEPVLTPIPRDALTDEQRPLYEAILGGRRGVSAVVPLTDEQGALYGPFDPILRSPEVGKAVSALGIALRSQTVLPRAVTEAAILTVAVHWAAEFEWYAHVAIVRDGRLLNERDIAAIREGQAPEEPEMLLAWKTAHAVLAGEQLPAELAAEVTRSWGERGLVELCILVGHYTHLALLMRSLGIEPPPER